MLSERRSHKRQHTVWFCLYEISRTGKSIERLVVPRMREGKREEGVLTGTGFQEEKRMKWSKIRLWL